MNQQQPYKKQVFTPSSPPPPLIGAENEIPELGEGEGGLQANLAFVKVQPGNNCDLLVIMVASMDRYSSFIPLNQKLLAQTGTQPSQIRAGPPSSHCCLTFQDEESMV